jgi:hypothetical protein
MEQPYSPNLSDSAECVILCTSWLPSPGKVSRQMWGPLSEQGSVIRGFVFLKESQKTKGFDSKLPVSKMCNSYTAHC